MPDQLYDAASRRCAFEELDPQSRNAMLAEAETQLLGDIAEFAIGCVETHSVPRRRPGVFTRLLSGGGESSVCSESGHEPGRKQAMSGERRARGLRWCRAAFAPAHPC
ncbi:hypothetical protein [Streptomyces sp. NBC_00878]|uniref:hypothetical protein n=1 Tax=Streptomyces sp. NBC_00878 TaxID=2975854 RepID=UPI0022505031|nr:hypothetical protein [Streptomyces sp. NBC_00878]MCX4904371.1 hypothetical protein [Streptomyces sp. NBC_00878]